MGRYFERIRETTRASREADDRLNSYQGEEYPEDLNEAAWEALQAKHRAWFGKD